MKTYFWAWKTQFQMEALERMKSVLVQSSEPPKHENNKIAFLHSDWNREQTQKKPEPKLLSNLKLWKHNEQAILVHFSSRKWTTKPDFSWNTTPICCLFLLFHPQLLDWFENSSRSYKFTKQAVWRESTDITKLPRTTEWVLINKHKEKKNCFEPAPH